MANEWIKATLGDFVDLQTGYPFESRRYSNDSSDIRLLRGDNIGQGNLRWEGTKYWPKLESNCYGEHVLREDDVVLAMDRPWIEAGLKYASIRTSDTPCLLVQRVARLRGGPHLDSRYLRYLIGSKNFTQYVLSVQTGTAVPHISGIQIKAFKFDLPLISDQRAIAQILGTLDDKIELNRRMNETLEAMARAIFQSWFVDFDPVRAKAEGRWKRGQSLPGLPADSFDLWPDSFADSPLGKIPKGWAVRNLDEIAHFLNGLALQKYPPDGKESLPVIKIAQLRKGSAEGSDQAAASLPSEYVVQDGDVLFSWSGSLEVVIWCGGKGALNQHLFKVTSKDFPKWFYYLWIMEYLSDFRAIASGKATTMGHIQRHHLTDAKVLVPSGVLVSSMDKVINPMAQTIVANNLQTRTLAAIRDTLLPKLISGEVRVPLSQRRAEAVTS